MFPNLQEKILTYKALNGRSIWGKEQSCYPEGQSSAKNGTVIDRKMRISLIQLKKEMRSRNVKEKFNQIHKWSERDRDLNSPLNRR